MIQTTSYAAVLRGALALCGVPSDRLDTVDWGRFREWADKHLTVAVQANFWPFYMRVERRLFRAAYDASTPYSNDGTIVFFYQTKKYYLALQATTGNPPADSAGDTDLSRWAEASTSYAGEDYDATAAYVAGDIIYYPTDDTFYQCHTASTGNAPTDTSYWGALTLFDRYVAWEQVGLTEIGDVEEVYDKDPYKGYQAQPVPFFESVNGVQILKDLPWVYLVFRTQAPELTGNHYDSAAAYAVGEQIYFDTGVAGNFYDCVATAAAGETPVTDPAKWAVVPVPLVFKRYLAQALFGEYLSDGQPEKAMVELSKAQALLDRESGQLTAVNQQRQNMVCMTR